MTIMKRLLLILLLQCSVVAQISSFQVNVPEASAPTYLMEEYFETPGYEESWTESPGTGTITDDDTTATVLQGSYQLKIAGGSSYIYNTSGISPGSDFWMYFMFKSDTADTTESEILKLRASGSTVATINQKSDGWLKVWMSTGNTSDSTGANSDGQSIHVWVNYVDNGGSNNECHLYTSTTSTRPGSPNASVTNGNSAAGQITEMQIWAAASNTHYWDNQIRNLGHGSI